MPALPVQRFLVQIPIKHMEKNNKHIWILQIYVVTSRYLDTTTTACIMANVCCRLSKNTLVNPWICIAGQVTALVQTMGHHEFKHPQSVSVANRVTACHRNTAQTVDSLQIMDLHCCRNTAQNMDSMDPHRR